MSSSDARDERFLEGAVACGALDAQTARRALEQRRAATPTSEPIEAFLVRAGLLGREGVERVFAHARGRTPPPTPPAARVTAPSVPVPRDSLLLESGPPPAPAPPDAPAPSFDPAGVTRTTPRTPGVRRLGSSSSGGTRRLPDRFGDYDIVDEIARGGMGVVYRARTSEGAEVALKVLLDDADATEEQVRRFQREIKTGLALDHPAIVKVFDGGRADGRLYFTMELVEGTSLDKKLPAMDLRAKVAILEKVARAVHHAHEAGYVHRDLKPQNVLVDAKGEPKVADFGLARSVDRHSRLTRTGALIGTPYYMAPEQARGEHATLDRRADVFSLGAMLYQALAGQLPFVADTAMGLIGKILNEDPQDPCQLDATCPPDLAAVALRALEKEPAARFPTALALADELARWLAGERVSTSREGRVRRLARRIRRSPRAVALVLVALVLSGAPGTFFFLRWSAARARAREVARAQDERDRRATIESVAKAAEVPLSSFAKLGEKGASRSAIKSLLADLERVRRAPVETAFPENAAPLAAALEEHGVLEKRDAAESALLVIDSATAREQDLPALATRMEELLRARPSRDDLRLALAAAREKLGGPEDAVALLADAAATGSTSVAVLEKLGEARLALDDVAGALGALETAVTLEPSHRSSRALLVRALATARDPAAIEVARPLREERTKDLPPRIALAFARWVEDPALGTFDLRSLEREASNDVAVVRRLAELLDRTERVDEARLVLDRAVELAPRDARTLVARADERLLQGDLAGALEDLAKAAELEKKGYPGRALALARSLWIESLAANPDQLGPILERARAALAERTRDANLRLLVADVAERAGKPLADDELVALARDLGTRRDAPRAWALLARARLARGQADPAREARGRAVELARARGSGGTLAEALGAGREGHAAFARDRGWSPRLLRSSNLRATYARRFKLPEDEKAAAVLLDLAERAAPWAGEPALERAMRVARAGAPAPEVAALAENALAKTGDDADGNALLAHALLDRDPLANAKRALALAEGALALAPDHPRAIAAKARAKAGFGEPGEALALFDRALALDHRDAAIWGWKAGLLERLGKTEECAKARQEALERGPKRDELAREATERANGMTLNGNPQVRESLPFYRRAIDLDPENAKAIYHLGIHLLGIGSEKGDPDEPIYLFTRAALLDPGVSATEGNTIRIMDLGTDVAAEAAHWEDRARKTGSFDDLWTAARLRSIRVEIGHEERSVLDAARLAFERVLCREPGTLSAFLYRGYVRAVDRQTDLARQDLERVVRYYPSCAFAWFAFAVAEARGGSAKEAKAHLAKAIELDTAVRERTKRHAELEGLLR